MKCHTREAAGRGGRRQEELRHEELARALCAVDGRGSVDHRLQRRTARPCCGRAERAQVLYHVSEETAFTTALEAYAALFPSKSVDDVPGRPTPGYMRTSGPGPRLVAPSNPCDPRSALTPAANDVHGYWYDYDWRRHVRSDSNRTTA